MFVQMIILQIAKRNLTLFSKKMWIHWLLHLQYCNCDSSLTKNLLYNCISQLGHWTFFILKYTMIFFQLMNIKILVLWWTKWILRRMSSFKLSIIIIFWNHSFFKAARELTCVGWLKCFISSNYQCL